MVLLAIVVSSRVFFKNKSRSLISKMLHSTIVASKPQHEFEGEDSNKMAAWQIHSYGGLEELQLGRNVRIPLITKPNDVLVKVLATSLNPLDLAMMGGYGSTLFNTMRWLKSGKNESVLEFPLILGRDFSGEVIAKGNNVSSELMVGDIVFGVTPPYKQGCHAQYVIADSDLVQRKPTNISVAEASSLLYTGLTAWSALQVTGGLGILPAQGKRVLVIGASGGVGTIAVQLLKAWKVDIVATCRTDAVPLVESLGAHTIIDYTQPDAMNKITSAGKYDIIFDAAGIPESDISPYIACLKDWSFAKYITLRSPLLRNTDTYGLIGGMFWNATALLKPNITSGAFFKGSSFRWGYFMPINKGVKEIARLVESKQIVPIVESTMSMTELPAAYEKLKSGHLRGKIVLTV